MKVRAVAPCRVDLAGGTLDIWPLGLLHPGACTVNVAVDVTVTVEMAPATTYKVVSGDVEVEAPAAVDLARHDGSRLAGAVLRHVDPGPVSVVMSSRSPRNAGLGASSSLCVALLASARRVAGLGELPAADLVHQARDLEARLMSLPTGIQDHYPALLGGVLEIRHDVGGEAVRPVAVPEDLSACLSVVYSGRSHFSAGNNFEVMVDRLRGATGTREAMSEIAEVSARVAPALEVGDFEEVGSLMAAEMAARRGLSEVVSTVEVEDVIDRASAVGAWGAKVCGAGGGGCVAILGPEERKGAIEGALGEAGYRVIGCGVSGVGLRMADEPT
ncbi:MAG: hypothetical protein R3190_07650 [Thermoanaerobaculia bacterium]|nr:hypothetical protein [Thermoanaerobaculia bacterium]